MYLVCVILHECMHKKVRYYNLKRKTPEKCKPREAGVYNEKKIFGSKFVNFNEILKLSFSFGEFMYDKNNWKPNFIKDYYSKHSEIKKLRSKRKK